MNVLIENVKMKLKWRDYLQDYLRFFKYNCAVSIRYFEMIDVFCIITRMAISPKRKILSLGQRVDILKRLDTGQ